MANGDNTPDSGSATATAPAPTAPYDFDNPDAAAAPSPAAASPATPAAPATPATPATPAAPPPQTQYHGVQPGPHEPMYQKIYDGVLTALGGAKTVTFSMPDPKTGQIVKHEDPSTPGQQWKRIIAGALSGLAASSQAGLGPGQKTRGLGLGIAGGQQAAQQDKAQQDKQRQQLGEDFDRQQKAAQESARTAALHQEFLRSQFELGRDQAKAEDEDRTAEQQLVASVKAGGDDAVDLGVHPHVMSVMELAKENPGLHIDQANGQLVSSVHVNDQGQRDGVHMAWVTKAFKDRKVAPGTKALKIDVGPDGKSSLGSEEALPDTTNGQLHDNNMSVQTQFNGLKLKEREQADKDKQADTEEKHLAGQLAQEYGAADETHARAKALGEGGSGEVYPRNVVLHGESIVNGNGALNDLNAKVREQVSAYLADKHPDLDQKSVDFTGDERKRAELANNAIHNLNDINVRLQRDPNLLGKLQGHITKAKTLIGTDDPDLAAINTALDNYALAATGAHGVRAVEARKAAKQSLLNGFKNGQQATNAALLEAHSSLLNLASAGTPRDRNGNPYKPPTRTGAPAPGAAASPPGAIPAPTTTPAPQQGGAFNWSALPDAKP